MRFSPQYRGHVYKSEPVKGVVDESEWNIMLKWRSGVPRIDENQNTTILVSEKKRIFKNPATIW